MNNDCVPSEKLMIETEKKYEKISEEKITLSANMNLSIVINYILMKNVSLQLSLETRLQKSSNVYLSYTIWDQE